MQTMVEIKTVESPHPGIWWSLGVELCAGKAWKSVGCRIYYRNLDTPYLHQQNYTWTISQLCLAKNPEHHGHMKHLDLCYYWLRDQVAIKKIQPLFKMEDMPADLLTRPNWWYRRDVGSEGCLGSDGTSLIMKVFYQRIVLELWYNTLDILCTNNSISLISRDRIEIT